MHCRNLFLQSVYSSGGHALMAVHSGERNNLSNFAFALCSDFFLTKRRRETENLDCEKTWTRFSPEKRRKGSNLSARTKQRNDPSSERAFSWRKKIHRKTTTTYAHARSFPVSHSLPVSASPAFTASVRVSSNIFRDYFHVSGFAAAAAVTSRARPAAGRHTFRAARRTRRRSSIPFVLDSKGK